MNEIPASPERPARLPFHPLLRYTARFLSIVFHPVLISSYLIAYLLFIDPLAFAGIDPRIKTFRFLAVFLSSTLLTVFAVFLMWRLGLFVKSIRLPTTRERIVPYAVALILFWWPYHVFNNLPDSPPEAVKMLLGSFLGVCVGWMCNIFFKISMHALAMGGLLMFMLLFTLHNSYASGLYLSLAILIAGIVCTARFIDSDHSAFEIYSGLAGGMIAQYIAWGYVSLVS
jgi:hypothetical protein